MRYQNLILVGSIIGIHGLKGYVKIKSFLENPNDIFKFDEFEKIYSLLSNDFNKLRFIIDIVFYKLKELFINNKDEVKRNSILELLTFINNNFNEDSYQDKKQELLIIFSEYFKIRK